MIFRDRRDAGRRPARALGDPRAARAGRGRIVLAVPVGPRETVERRADEVDEVVCLQTPEPFLGVGRWYDDFAPTSDEEDKRT